MRSLSSLNGPAAVLLHFAHPKSASRHSGEGAASVLPPVNDDASRRPKPPVDPGEHPGTATSGDGGNAKAPVTNGPLKVGKYLVSPLIKVLENGWFASSVSIRSGSGSGTTDRVLRLTRMFRCAKEAAAYAHAEGLRWIGDSHGPRLAAMN
jgi:hypothetical protein